MATTLFLTDDPVTNHHDARFIAMNTAGSSTRTRNKLSTSRDSAAVTRTLNTQNGAFGPVELTDSSNRRLMWLSDPIDTDVTISGTVTFNIWGSENSMSANACHYANVWRVFADSANTPVAILQQTTDNAELGTSSVANGWTATPTSTNFLKGDRIAVALGFGSAPGVTMASGFTVSTIFAGPTGGASGDTFITFNETFGFITATPSGTILFFRDTLSAIDGYDADWNTRAMDTARGASAAEKRAFISGATSQGSVIDPTANPVGDTSDSATAWKLPGAAANFETGENNWNNPSNVLTDNGSVTSMTTGPIGHGDELHMTGFDWTAENVYGRVIGAGYRCECRQNPATGFDSLAYASSIFTGFGGFGTLTTTLTLFTQDPKIVQFGGMKLGADARDSAYLVYFHDDGSGSQGFTYEADYLENKLYFRQIDEWMTDTIASGFTLSGLIRCNLRTAKINATSNQLSIGVQVCRVNGDGTSPTVFGWGHGVVDSGTSEAAITVDVAGDDLSISAGQRLRFRVFANGAYQNDSYGATSLTSPPEQRFWYDGPTGGASGDSYVQLTQSITFGAPGFAQPPVSTRMARDRYGAGVR